MLSGWIRRKSLSKSRLVIECHEPAFMSVFDSVLLYHYNLAG